LEDYRIEAATLGELCHYDLIAFQMQVGSDKRKWRANHGEARQYGKNDERTSCGRLEEQFLD
jgi:hypothetical protein